MLNFERNFCKFFDKNLKTKPQRIAEFQGGILNFKTLNLKLKFNFKSLNLKLDLNFRVLNLNLRL